MSALAELDLVIEEVFAHPIEKVWTALTDREHLAGWRGWANCEVLKLKAPRRMVWPWISADDGLKTTVTFELEALPAGTQLTLHHAGGSDATITELLAGRLARTPGRALAAAGRTKA